MCKRLACICRRFGRRGISLQRQDRVECDTVLHLRNGQYGLIEIKLGGDELINDGASALKTLADKIDTTKMKKPSFLMVLTAVGDFAYQRKEDSVFVIPIGCLRD